MVPNRKTPLARSCLAFHTPLSHAIVTVERSLRVLDNLLSIVSQCHCVLKYSHKNTIILSPIFCLAWCE